MPDNPTSMRKEMEAAIESASGGLHDSTEWWSDYYSDIYGKPLIEVLLDSLEEIAARHERTIVKHWDDSEDVDCK